jgi:hypothetical protein
LLPGESWVGGVCCSCCFLLGWHCSLNFTMHPSPNPG